MDWMAIFQLKSMKMNEKKHSESSTSLLDEFGWGVLMNTRFMLLP